MIQCSKCGFSNKYSGMCKQCGTVNVPPISVGKRISEMSTKQKILGAIIAVIHTVWALSVAINVVIYAVAVILSCFMKPDAYAAVIESAPVLSVELPVAVGSAPVLISFATTFIALFALAAVVFLYICSLSAIIKYGRAMTIIQAFWIFAVAFSIYAIGAINYELFVLSFFMGIAVSLLLVLYRRYEFNDK